LNLLGAAATVSGITLLSRVTGLIRENVTASIFGASALTDAFFVAFRLPNLLRRLFAEGAFSQAFVPMLAHLRTQGDPEAARRTVDTIATALFWTLVAVSIAGVAAAPLLVWAMASGLARDAAAFESAVVMTRWMFPYILFISMVALSAGILNTWRRFALPAFSPVLLNLCFIGAALGLSSRFDPPVYALAAGVVMGGVAQLAIQVPALRRLGMLPRIRLDFVAAWRDAATRRLLSQMAPAVLSVSVAQISLVINTQIASRLAPGSVSWVTYADRLMEFPTALLGVALGTVLLPSLAKAGAESDPVEFSALLDWGLRLVVVLSLPCMVGLAMMSEALTALLFNYGRFGAHDVAMTRVAVMGYSAGLIGLIAVKVLAPGFYARQDTRTPVRIGLAVLAATQALNLVLVPVFAHAGLTLSISIGALANAGLLLWGLLREGSYRPAPGWGGFVARVFAGCAAMAIALALAFAGGGFDWVALRAQPWLRIATVLALVAGAAIVYIGVLVLAGIRPRDFLRRTRTSRGGSP
jgi:putative peptidoglycan lipid II flippase